MDKMLENLKIRKIRLEDADQIGKIQSAIIKSGPEIDFRRIIGEQLSEMEHASFVAEVGGKVVGYMITYVIYGGFGIEKSAWIATLGVDPRFMGQGIGRRLFQKIMEVYREKKVEYIFTSVKWDAADLLSFFKTLGFDRSSFINLRKKL